MKPAAKDYSLEDLVALLRKANEAYAVGEPVMTDAEYDIYYDYLKEKHPNHPFLKEVGAEPTTRVKLPYYMGSMNKVNAEAAKLKRWLSKFGSDECDYHVSDKLDGVSALLVVGKDSTVSMYTRGNGTYGQDISALVQELKLKQKIGKSDPCVIRGELIISKSSFQQIRSKDWKYKDSPNARNLVAGAIGSKAPSPLLPYIDFVAYELIEPTNLTPYQQFHWIQKHQPKLKTAFCKLLKVSEITVESLSQLLLDRRSNGDYDIDGLIVTHNEVHPRSIGENPAYAIAFKSPALQDSAETTVENIEWNVSKDGKLIPTVKVSPIHIGGVTIRSVTGNNANFIESKKIGIGARVEVVRSGDVIPKIIKIITPSKVLQMPTGQWKWDATHTHALATDRSDEQDVKECLHFFEHLNDTTHGIKGGTIKTLYEHGYKTPSQILNLTKEEILKVRGFKEKSAENLYTSLQKIKSSLTCMELMVASNAFGSLVSKKRLELVFQTYPKFLTETYSVEELKTISGIGEKVAQALHVGIIQFRKYIKTHGFESICESALKSRTQGLVVKDNQRPVIVNPSSTVNGKKVLFTGFRSTELEDLVIRHGGTIGSGLNKTIDVLVYKAESDKVERARAMGIKTILRETLEKELQA